MRFKKATFLVFLICYFAVGTTAGADRVENSYQRAAKKYHVLYRDTPFRDKRHNWLNTIKQFELIYKKNPRHYRAPDSLFNIGHLYRSLYKWNQNGTFLDRSSIYFRKLVAEYPDSKLSDNAQFLLAENYDRYKKDSNLAYLEYQKVVDLFPRSEVAEKARKQMRSIKPPSKDLQLRVVKENKGFEVTGSFKSRYGGISSAASKRQSSPLLVSKIDYWSTSDWSRMVINVKSGVRYKYQGLPPNRSKGKGRRIYLDIYNSYIPKKFKKRIAANDGLIKQARIAQFDKKTVRIVLDIASLKKINVYPVKLPNQYKIIVDILGKAELEKQQFASKVYQPERTDTKSNKELKIKRSSSEPEVSLSRALGLKVKRIILDPGHGGKDPGASAFGLKEKNIALKMGLALRRIIRQKHPEIEVLMTREKDRFLPLEERTAFANKHQGDLFISIHLNASEVERVKGIETYILHLTEDNTALALAARENQTSLKSISELQGILNELMTDIKIVESTKLATFIQGTTFSTVKDDIKIKTRNLGVKRAPFIVLLGARMPSVLIESGFITNRQENKLLRTPKYQRIVAEGIYRGIRKYMN